MPEGDVGSAGAPGVRLAAAGACCQADQPMRAVHTGRAHKLQCAPALGTTECTCAGCLLHPARVQRTRAFPPCAAAPFPTHHQSLPPAAARRPRPQPQAPLAPSHAQSGSRPMSECRDYSSLAPPHLHASHLGPAHRSFYFKLPESLEFSPIESAASTPGARHASAPAKAHSLTSRPSFLTLPNAQIAALLRLMRTTRRWACAWPCSCPCTFPETRSSRSQDAGRPGQQPTPLRARFEDSSTHAVYTIVTQDTASLKPTIFQVRSPAPPQGLPKRRANLL